MRGAKTCTTARQVLSKPLSRPLMKQLPWLREYILERHDEWDAMENAMGKLERRGRARHSPRHSVFEYSSSVVLSA
jgi:hypothetical protein